MYCIQVYTVYIDYFLWLWLQVYRLGAVYIYYSHLSFKQNDKKVQSFRTVITTDSLSRDILFVLWQTILDYISDTLDIRLNCWKDLCMFYYHNLVKRLWWYSHTEIMPKLIVFGWESIFYCHCLLATRLFYFHHWRLKCNLNFGKPYLFVHMEI